MNNLVNKNEYYEDFSKIIIMIKKRRNNAYRKVNEELISLYWDIGCFVSKQIQSNKWGSKVVDKSCIYRMKQFYETYKDNEIVSPLVTQLSWTNNLLILSSTGENNYSNTKLFDLYSLKFLDLLSEFSKVILRKAIIKNLKNFILKIGKSFTFKGGSASEQFSK